MLAKNTLCEYWAVSRLDVPYIDIEPTQQWRHGLVTVVEKNALRLMSTYVTESLLYVQTESIKFNV